MLDNTQVAIQKSTIIVQNRFYLMSQICSANKKLDRCNINEIKMLVLCVLFWTVLLLDKNKFFMIVLKLYHDTTLASAES